MELLQDVQNILRIQRGAEKERGRGEGGSGGKARREEAGGQKYTRGTRKAHLRKLMRDRICLINNKQTKAAASVKAEGFGCGG